MMNALLTKLGIQEVNPGACTGPDGWISDPQGKPLVSYNPTTNSPIATVIHATPATYEQWWMLPIAPFSIGAPCPRPNGASVRDLGNALRELKEPWAI